MLQVMLAKTRSFVVAWYGCSNGKLLSDVNDWLTCMTADAVVKAAMGVVRRQSAAAAACTVCVLDLRGRS